MCKWMRIEMPNTTIRRWIIRQAYSIGCHGHGVRWILSNHDFKIGPFLPKDGVASGAFNRHAHAFNCVSHESRWTLELVRHYVIAHLICRRGKFK